MGLAACAQYVENVIVHRRAAETSGSARRRHHASKRRPAPAFWVLLALLILVFCTGGSFRATAPFLFVLRPFAILIAAYGIATMPSTHWRAFQVPFVMAGLVLLLTVVHLVPLPPGVWQNLSGHDLMRRIGDTAGLNNTWRPLSLAPATTLNALFALSVPLAALLLAGSLNLRDHILLLWSLLGLAAVSAAVGMLQATGVPFNLYVAADSVRGIEATGLFANKNHQAALLAAMLPMLAVTARIQRTRTRSAKVIDGLAGVAAIFILLLLIVSGSRAGLFLGLLAIAATLFYDLAYIPPLARMKPRKAFAIKLVIGGSAAALAAATAILTSRDLAFSRLSNAGADLRPRLWESILPILPQYQPLGSGIGSYVEIYKIHEPLILLRDTYSNHAHNEFLEVALTAGIPGLLLLIVAALFLVRALWSNRQGASEGALLARLGGTMIVLLAVASLTDYPLRTPMMAAIFSVAVIWACGVARGRASATDPNSGLDKRSLV